MASIIPCFTQTFVLLNKKRTVNNASQSASLLNNV